MYVIRQEAKEKRPEDGEAGKCMLRGLVGTR
jgi:hypothetical protein